MNVAVDDSVGGPIKVILSIGKGDEVESRLENSVHPVGHAPATDVGHGLDLIGSLGRQTLDAEGEFLGTLAKPKALVGVVARAPVHHVVPDRGLHGYVGRDSQRIYLRGSTAIGIVGKSREIAASKGILSDSDAALGHIEQLGVGSGIQGEAIVVNDIRDQGHYGQKAKRDQKNCQHHQEAAVFQWFLKNTSVE